MTTQSLCFGGSFNPIHHGHLICARAAAKALDFGRVLLIPSAQPPHKQAGPELAPAEDRLEMCRIVAAADALFDAADIELHRAGPSYTIDTIRQLKAKGMKAVHWLIGADMLRFLPHWHRPLEILAEAELHIMARPGVELDFDSMPEPFRRLRDCVVPTPLADISATDIRGRIRQNLPVNDLLPAEVAEYIARRGLYR